MAQKCPMTYQDEKLRIWIWNSRLVEWTYIVSFRHIISLLASEIKEKNNNLSLKVKKKLYPSVYSENRVLILFDVLCLIL